MTYGTGIDIRDVLPMTAGSDIDAFHDALTRLRESMQRLFDEIDNTFRRGTASDRYPFWGDVDAVNALIAEVREWTRDELRSSWRLATEPALAALTPLEALVRGRVDVVTRARRSLAPRQGLRARRYGWRRGRAC